ncbi:hypothetical protein P8452_70604 [Trifolium repens]|nr:hypothetical protein P8452_70604 [Trifolium repens]
MPKQPRSTNPQQQNPKTDPREGRVAGEIFRPVTTTTTHQQSRHHHHQSQPKKPPTTMNPNWSGTEHNTAERPPTERETTSPHQNRKQSR